MFELAVAKMGIVFEMGKLLGEIFSEIGLADARLWAARDYIPSTDARLIV